MTYVKTTANERRQQVKLRYIHLSPKGSEPHKGLFSQLVHWFTPQRIENQGLGKEPKAAYSSKHTNGAFGGNPLKTGIGPQKTSGSKLLKRFDKYLQKPRGY